MSVWVAIPSARPVAEVNGWAAKWRAQGYKVALLTDDSAPRECDLQIVAARYEGYSVSVNYLAKRILSPDWAGSPGNDPACDWIVCTGDDTDPDPTKRAEEIAAECSKYFRDLAWPKNWCWAAGYNGPQEALAAGAYAEQKPQALWSADLARIYSTWGVMQPTGDPWRDAQGRIIERIAGSPWLGREWCQRAYGGRGPLFDGYTHCFADEELQLVAQKLGVFWQRPDLAHHHRNWARKDGATHADRPAFLNEANSAAHWAKYSALFAERRAAGFPGHEPLTW